MSADLSLRARRVALWRAMVLAGTALTAVPLILTTPDSAWAACATSGTITTNCNVTSQNESNNLNRLTGDLKIESGVTITGPVKLFLNEDLPSAVAFENAGILTSTGGLAAVENREDISTFKNSGTITGTYSGVELGIIYTSSSPTVGSFENSGSIYGGKAVAMTTGTLGSFTNAQGGNIAGTGTNPSVFGSGVFIGATTVTSFNNAGSITGDGVGDDDSGVVVAGYGNIITLNNTGTISGSDSGLFVNEGEILGNDPNDPNKFLQGPSGQIGTINNSGTITQSGTTNGARAITLEGHIGTLNNTAGGNITSTAYHGYGILLREGLISKDYTNAHANFGSIGTLANDGTISANPNGGTAIAVESLSSITTLTNTAAGTISGYVGVDNAGTITTILNQGTIDADTGIKNAGTITTLTNENTISSGHIGLHSTGTITTFINAQNATISGLADGIRSEGTFQTLTNDGSITGNNGIWGLNNTTTVGTFTNNGTITGNNVGINWSGQITDFKNSDDATIKGLGSNATHSAIQFGGNSVVGTFENAGSIEGTGKGLRLLGTITTFKNTATGSITATGDAIHLSTTDSNIVDFDNAGTISGQTTGLNTQGTIQTMTNQGTISSTAASSTAIVVANTGTITDLTNKGTITAGTGSGSTAINISGTVTTLTNDGTGSILATGTNGAAIWVGDLNGAGMLGTLDNAGVISGASGGNGYGVRVTSALTSFLNRDTGSVTANYAVTGSGTITDFDNAGTVHGQHAALTVLGSVGFTSGIINSGTIAGPEAIHFAEDSGFGELKNSGKILGTIINEANQNLYISGGSGNSYGTISGYAGNTTAHTDAAHIGQITNTGSNIIFQSGNVLLNSHINAGVNQVINNGATIQVNNAINVTGSLAQGSPSAVLAFGVNPDGTYGSLKVSRDVIITGGTLVLKALNGATLQNGQTYRVVISENDSMSSTAPLVVNGFGTSAYTIVEENSKKYLEIVLGGGSNGGNNGGNTTPATESAATPAVEAVKTIPVTAQTLQLTAAIDALSSTAEANKAGNQLRPAANGVSSQAAQAAGAQVMNVVAGRNDAMRIASTDRKTGIATGEAPQGMALWAEGFGVNTSQAHRQSVDGYNAWTGGMAVGGDIRVGESTRLGLVGSYAYTDVSDEGDRAGSGTTINSYGATLYASYSPGAWYLDGSAGIGLHRYETARRMDFTGFSATASGDHDAWQYLARVDAGYPLPLGSSLGDAVLTPIAGLAFSRLEERAYTETGGNGAALHVGAVESDSVRSTLGFKLARSVDTSWGEVTPQVKLAWLHEFADVSQSSNSAYVAGGSPFSTPGVRQPRDGLLAGIGITLVSGQSYTLSANYDAEVRPDYISQAGRIRLRSEF